MSQKTTVSICVVVVFAAGISAYLGEWGSGARMFASSYEVFAEALIHETASLRAPGRGDSEVRQELDILLREVLGGVMDNETRLRFSERGVAKGSRMKDLLRAIAEAESEVENEARILKERARHVEGLRLRWTAFTLVHEIRERKKFSLEISKILHAMHVETTGIFEQIIADEGALTPEHITRLNNSTAAAENRFNRLGELYKDLGSSDAKIVAHYEEFQKQRGFYLFK